MLVLEAALRVGAAYIRVHGRGTAVPSVSNKYRVLCLGDSNTYGVYLDKSQAYPKVFEELWNAQPGVRPIEVSNLGFPGTNSSRLLADFPRMLRAFQPDLITVMVGANDYWTVPVVNTASDSWMERVVRTLWNTSRVFRLLYMVRRAVQAPQLDIRTDPAQSFEQGRGTASYGGYEFELGWTQMPAGTIPFEAASQALEGNLIELAQQAKGEGVKLFFLTYPAKNRFYALADAVVHDVANLTATPLIDLAGLFRPLCPDSKCPELFPDLHPTAAGHERVARLLIQRLKPEIER